MVYSFIFQDFTETLLGRSQEFHSKIFIMDTYGRNAALIKQQRQDTGSTHVRKGKNHF